MAYLKLHDITKIYESGSIGLRDFSLEVNSGEFISIIGPSGCGKSTLLRVIAGLEKPNRGKIYMDNEEISDVDSKDRNIAMVFQNYSLYPHLTVFDNIAFPLKIKHLNVKEISDKVHHVASLLNIEELLTRKPKQLSGGQKQRVCLARAIVRDAKLYLFDEPLSNLDKNAREDIRQEIKTLHNKLNATFIYVTHDIDEAISLADRLVIMNDGEIKDIQITNLIEKDFVKNLDFTNEKLYETFPISISNKNIKVGKNTIELPGFFKKRLLIDNETFDATLFFNKSYLSVENENNSLCFPVDVISKEDCLSYSTYTYKIKGLDNTYKLVLPVSYTKKINNIYLPITGIRVLDKSNRIIFSREEVLPNKCKIITQTDDTCYAFGTNLNNISTSGYKELYFSPYSAEVIFNKKLNKKHPEHNKEINIENKIKFSAIDEYNFKDQKIIYGKIDGVEKYATIVVKNDFSVFDMYTFDINIKSSDFKMC